MPDDFLSYGKTQNNDDAACFVILGGSDNPPFLIGHITYYKNPRETGSSPDKFYYFQQNIVKSNNASQNKYLSDYAIRHLTV